ncbi:MAG: flagellar filament capping protein FliD [Bdellovibrionales bacterium]|nr:flagellar filament capping protein FliD [Bdellovibrionales bacterium]
MPLINFSGLASGIDSEALIDATVEARRAVRVVPKEEEIAELEGENTAFAELTTLLDELKSILLDFTDLSGGGVSKTVSSSDETTVTAVASNSANNGTYTISSVTALAENATFTYGESISSTTDTIMDPGDTGTSIVTIGTGSEAETFNINVTDTTTYADYVTQFNASTDKATAQLVNIAAPSATADYRIVITTNNVGTSLGALTIDNSTAGTGGSLDDHLSTAGATTDPATDSSFVLSGVGTITRSSNTINDVIPGVTFTLEDTGGSNIVLQVQTDSSGTESAVSEFIEKYNEIVEFINENNLITREENGANIDNIFGPLANTRVDDGVLSSLRSEIVGSTYDITTNAVRIFADLGITTERDGTLAFDTDDFQDALSDEPDSVNQILQNFANATAKTGELLEQYTRFNGIIDNAETNNNDRIEDINKEIARAEEFIEREATQIRTRFARLEATISQLQSQQQALTSALAGLGAGQ